MESKTSTLCKDGLFPDGEWFDADYFEKGRITGKGWYMDHRWMPQRSFREALAIIDYLKLDVQSRLLDVGCAKGFLVRALRALEIRADGCDISEYALSYAPFGCWLSDHAQVWTDSKDFYTHVFVKDVFEHNSPDQLHNLLRMIAIVAPQVLCVVPLGDKGKYRIPEYHIDQSHIIAENEKWWGNAFWSAGWRVKNERYHILGIKDNWQDFAQGKGNMAFTLERRDVA